MQPLSSLEKAMRDRVTFWLGLCEGRKLGVSLSSTLRSTEEQAAIRRAHDANPALGPAAQPGKSCHEVGYAIDARCIFGFNSNQWHQAVMLAGVAMLDHPLPQTDPGHFQMTSSCRAALADRQRQQATKGREIPDWNVGGAVNDAPKGIAPTRRRARDNCG